MESEIGTIRSVSHSEKPVCLNCGAHLRGRFCSECGQSAGVQRVNARYLFVELLGGAFQLDHGFIFTARELLLRPGKSLHAFLAGQRRSFSRPFGFLLLASAFYVLVSYWLGTGTVLGEFLSGVDGASESSSIGILKWLASHYTYASLLLLPLFALCMRLIFFKSGLCYSEHLVVSMFVKGELALLMSGIYPLLELSPVVFAVVWMFLGLYPFYALGQVFSYRHWLLRILGVTVCYILYWSVLFGLLFLIVGYEKIF